MVDSWIIAVPMGTVLGFLSGLGTGGGSLLILWLTMAAGMEQAQARVINLMFFIPSALIACLFRWKQGRLALRKVLPAIGAGMICAGLGSWLSTALDTQLLKKLFGALLLAAGARELFYRPREFR